MKKNIGIWIASLIIVIGIILILFIETRNTPGQLPDVSITQPTDEVENESIVIEPSPLPIPPLLEDKSDDPDKAEFELHAEHGVKEFLPGKETETMGYNGDYLGPVIQVRKGQDVAVKVNNDLKSEVTTMHWHGLEVDGENDGGPHSGIQAGESWTSEFTIDQPASTLWFHPHPEQQTGKQVYKGLAGLFFIEDEQSDKLDIPKSYGENDVPLVLQDKRFDKDGNANYELAMPDVMNGLQGNSMLVNGVINPYLEVPQGMMRLRLLNGSNASVYTLNFSEHETFYQIASDGGFLEAPVEMNELVLGPAERAEILVDFSDFKKGDTVQLVNGDKKFMDFVVKNEAKETFTVPTELTTIEKIAPETASTTREFVFQGMGPHVNINGKQMDMDRIDEEVSLDNTEIWEVSNDSSMGMMGGTVHPFHAHGTQFQILDRDGKAPPSNEAGWKDTFLVDPGETVRVIATFEDPGVFMYHCHILEHEDAGMMGQFLVK